MTETKFMKKKLLLIIVGMVLLFAVINFFAGATITVNGKPVTGMGGYLAAYVALVIGIAALIIIVPSVLFLAIALMLGLSLLLILFFPLIPFAYPLLPVIILIGLGYFLYQSRKKKAAQGSGSGPQ